MTFQPIIKWSGSKRSQADEIITVFPKEIDTYYEPFCGGASMTYRLLHSDIKCNRYVLSDKNFDLIDLWKDIMVRPDYLMEEYTRLWGELNLDNDIARKKRYYTHIRDIFNRTRYTSLFLFIMRTCTNGMPRYNDKGEFNNSFHVTRNGITPDKLEKILFDWHYLLNDNNVSFLSQDYKSIKPTENDFVYLDPPYANTRGMYYGSIDLDTFFDTISHYPYPWALSFDGKNSDKDNTYNVPMVYDEHLYIKSGNSSFKRVIGKSKDSIVYESLYVKNGQKA